MNQIPAYFKEEFCKAFQFESSNFIKFNSSSKSSSKRLHTSKLIVSPKKKDMNTISTNDKTTTLLAKYNLYVGLNCPSTSSCTPISPSDSRYGLQSVDAKGYVSSSSMVSSSLLPSYCHWEQNQPS